jgi:hypothetical protein
MQSTDFLSAVLPTEGKYCVFTLRGEFRKNIFVDSIENVQATAEAMSAKGYRAYFAMASFDDEGFRKVDNVRCLRALFMDLDCGKQWVEDKEIAGVLVPAHWKDKAFPSKKAAVLALHQFMTDTGLDALGSPWLVDSGTGVHVHWPLADQASLAAWLPVATALKRAAAQHGFPIDETVTDDAARVLGVPGTHNNKYDPPKPITLRYRGDVFQLEALRTTLAPYASATLPSIGGSSALALLGPKPKGPPSAVAMALAGNSTTYFKDILVRTQAGTGCAQLAYFMEHAQDDGLEPLWRALLSLTKFSMDGEKAALKISSLHPYDTDRMHRKLAEIKAPYLCATFDKTNSGVCAKCPNYQKINTPMVLGKRLQVTNEPKEAEVVDDEGVAHVYQRPPAPFGFGYGANVGVYHIKPPEGDAPEKHTMLLSYDFFMTRQFLEARQYVCEFTYYKGASRTTFVIPMSSITKEADCIKELASHNVIASHGIGCDRHLAAYTRACAQTFSVANRVVQIPARFGWQEDGRFAVHDTMYDTNAPEHNYTYVSDRIHNIIAATEPKGCLEDWVRVVHMLRKKAQGEPMVWGHIAMLGVGLGSMFQQFMPPGANAPTMHMCSTGTGAGKTLALSLATSVWGSRQKYVVSADTSERTMFQRAGLLGNLPLCIDEITAKNREYEREWLPNFIFGFSNGAHKLKGSAAGNMEILHELIWASNALITSNTPGLEAMTGARGHTSEGEARRHLEWELPKSFSLQWTDDERDILKLLNENYGVVGPLLAQWCVTRQDRVRKVLRDVGRVWLKESNCGDEERFWTSLVVTSVGAFILAGPDHAGLLEIPAKPLMDFWLGIVQRARRIIYSNRMSAVDVLHAYLREHNHEFIRVGSSPLVNTLIGGGGVVDPIHARSRVRGRIEYELIPGITDIFIEEKLLKLHCANANVGFTAFVEELASTMIVRTGIKDLVNGTKSAPLRVRCVRVRMKSNAIKPGTV